MTPTQKAGIDRTLSPFSLAVFDVEFGGVPIHDLSKNQLEKLACYLIAQSSKNRIEERRKLKR